MLACAAITSTATAPPSAVDRHCNLFCASEFNECVAPLTAYYVSAFWPPMRHCSSGMSYISHLCSALNYRINRLAEKKHFIICVSTCICVRCHVWKIQCQQNVGCFSWPWQSYHLFTSVTTFLHMECVVENAGTH